MGPSTSTLQENRPPWLDPFRHAVVRLATFVDRGAPPRLVFATVELLAPDRPAPASGPLQDRRFGKGSSGRVFFRRVAMGAAEAVAWYEAAARGALITPVPADPAEREAQRDGILIDADPFIFEPPWPDLVLPLDGDPLLDPTWPGSPTPFIGSGASPARISRLFSPPRAGLAAALREEAVAAFLKPRLHVDLARYPEYRAGVVLIVPDPVAREVRMSVRPRSDSLDGGENVVVRVLPREGGDLSGLALTLVEMRGGALYRHEQATVPEDGLVVWRGRHQTAMSGFVLTHATQGILRYQAPTAFLRTVTVVPNVASRHVSIHAPMSESPQARQETYDVTEYEPDRNIDVGSAPGRDDGLSRVYEAEQRRRRLAAAEGQGQRWLDDRDLARVHIRKILQGASRRLWIADPYLGGNQVFQFIHAVGRLSVEVRLITSRLAFEGRDPSGEGVDSGDVGRLKGLIDFALALKSLRERGFADVETWVLRGKSPPLHDRFLVVDKAVWLSGNSLNAIGSRAGVIIKVPDPDAVIDRLAALRHDAQPFDEYLKQRVKAKTSKGRRGERVRPVKRDAKA